MTYRNEIDGLRAIAVLGVILYHAGFGFMGSGYAGVDIFFVISGYLIGGQILSDLAAGTFRFREFYARRARRILPALFAMIAATCAAGAFILLPHDFRYLFGAAVTALLSLSNFWFLDQIDYFNPQAAHDPLIHTWSLGVEEQFYLFVPLLCWALWRWLRGRIGLVLVILVVLSFALCLRLSVTAPAAAFYLLPTRAWELLAGILVAMTRPRLCHLVANPLQAALSLVGLVLLGIAVAAVPASARWPGPWTLVPVLGTALVLMFGATPSLARRTLTLPPVRLVGLVSYSSYLWHQPILSFLDYTGRAPVTPATQAAVVLATLALSALSWRYIEQPFRARTIPPRLGRALLAGVAAGVFVVAIGAHVTRGYPGRLPRNVTAILDLASAHPPNYMRCLRGRRDVAGMDLAASCVLGADARPTVALWGDSHGAAIADSLAGGLARQGHALQAFLLSSCQPIPGLINATQQIGERCPEFNDKVLDYILNQDNLRTVVLFATWDNYFRHGDFPDMFGVTGEDEFFSFPTGASPEMDEAARRAAVRAAVADLFRRLDAAGKRVVVVQSLPRPQVDVPRLIARRLWSGHEIPHDLGYDIASFRAQTALGRELFAGVAEEFRDGAVTLVDPEPAFCNNAHCFVVRGGEILFFDGNHPSEAGAARLVPLILPAVAAPPRNLAQTATSR